MSHPVIPVVANPEALKADGLGCHSGKDQLNAAARAAEGKFEYTAELVDQNIGGTLADSKGIGNDFL